MELQVRVGEIAEGLEPGDDGIWRSVESEAVSYPDDGSARCFGLEDESFWFVHRNRCILAVVAHYPPAGPIFDIGGGNGFVSAGLVRNGYDAVLVEPSVEGARNARLRGLEPVICSTLQSARFLEGALPAAGLFDVVEHVEDDRRFFRLVRSSLAPGGRLYVTVPGFQTLWSADDVRAGHFRRYSLSHITEVLACAGFRVEFASYFFSFLVVPVAALRVIPSRLGLRDSDSIDPKQEHAPSSPRVGAALEWLSRRETERLRQGRRIPFGTSCLVVARAESLDETTND